MISCAAMLSQLGGCWEIGGGCLLSSSAPRVHHGEGRTTVAEVFDDEVVAEGGADHVTPRITPSRS
jgi:hypothetical protein